MSENWFEHLINEYPMETRAHFGNRINSYIWRSIPEYGEFWTIGKLITKVEENGKLKPFYGNTMVFGLDDAAVSYVEKVQKALYSCCEEVLAEPLKKETFHMTLHDLVNGPVRHKIENKMIIKGFAALGILKQLKEMDIPPIRMVSNCVFNMASTSLVLGMQPADEQSHKAWNLLYELFQTVVELEYKSTPHITLAYFKPGIHQAEDLAPLRDLISELNQDEKLVVELNIKDLVYQEFQSMNDYMTKDCVGK